MQIKSKKQTKKVFLANYARGCSKEEKLHKLLQPKGMQILAQESKQPRSHCKESVVLLSVKDSHSEVIDLTCGEFENSSHQS